MNTSIKKIKERVEDRINKEGKIILRPSSIQQFLRCPHQWLRVNLLGEKVAPAAAARAGNALHSAFEYGFKYKKDKQKLPPLDEMLDLAVQEWKKLDREEELRYRQGEDYNLYEKDIIAGVSKYYEEVMPYLNPIYIEERFTVKVDNPLVEAFSGTADLIIGDEESDTLHLVDYKFTKRKTHASSYLLQQNSYTWLARENGYNIVSSVLHNIVRPSSRSDAKIEVIEVEYKEKYLKFWVNKLLEALEEFWYNNTGLLLGGSDPVTNYLCSPEWCGFWDDCIFVEGLRNEEKLDIKGI